MPEELVRSPTPSRSRLTILVILMALFAAGVLGGVALDRFVLHHRHGPFAGMGMGRPGAPESAEQRAAMQRHLADRISRDLDLTADQRRQLEAILPRHIAAFDSLRLEMGTRLQVLLDSSSTEIETILTPEQRQKWETNRHRFELRRRPPPSPLPR
jgi:Spy/CpxP family protein refolding chaperone